MNTNISKLFVLDFFFFFFSYPLTDVGKKKRKLKLPIPHILLCLTVLFDEIFAVCTRRHFVILSSLRGDNSSVPWGTHVVVYEYSRAFSHAHNLVIKKNAIAQNLP